MRFLFGCALILLALRSFADTSYTTQIHQVDKGAEGEDPIVLLSNGLVAHTREDYLADHLEVASIHQSWVNIRLDGDRRIVAVESAEAPVHAHDDESGELKYFTYNPSVIPSLRQATAVFKKLNRRYNDESQCYNRAHVWSWEMYHKHRINSMKIFVFFTPKYIRKYAFEWWFHVAPYVHVNEDGQSVERVFDFRYSNSPKKMKEWTDIFMHNNAECKPVAKYTDYEYTRSNADAPWCMLLRVPMYYYQPLDLEAMDKQNKIRHFWEEWEVSNAYREAFSYRRGH